MLAKYLAMGFLVVFISVWFIGERATRTNAIWPFSWICRKFGILSAIRLAKLKVLYTTGLKCEDNPILAALTITKPIYKIFMRLIHVIIGIGLVFLWILCDSLLSSVSSTEETLSTLEDIKYWMGIGLVLVIMYPLFSMMFLRGTFIESYEVRRIFADWIYHKYFLDKRIADYEELVEKWENKGYLSKWISQKIADFVYTRSRSGTVYGPKQTLLP